MTKKRLKILSQLEINELYNIPCFTKSEQQAFFSLNNEEYTIMNSRRSVASKVHFILQLGYFKATSQFFSFAFNNLQQDVNFILNEHLNNSMFCDKMVSKQTRQTNQLLIAKSVKYETNKTKIYSNLKKMLETKSRTSCNPIYLFHEILCYNQNAKLMLLGYSTLQDLIGHAISSEEERLSKIITKQLTSKDWEHIENTLSKTDNEYILTALKKDPKSFKTKHVKAEISKLSDNLQLYYLANRILPKLDITHQNITYYASLAEHNPINDIKKLSSTKKALYILSFYFLRHQKIKDNLTMSFMYYINKYQADASGKTRDRIFADKMEINNDCKGMAIILRFFDDENISDDTSFGSVRKNAFKHVERGKFSEISDYLQGLLFDYQAIRWEEIAKLKGCITKNIRSIFNVLEIDGDKTQKNLLASISFLKKYFASTSKIRKKMLANIPISCIPKKWKQYLIISSKDESNSEDVIDLVKYEFMIYQLILEKIEAGNMYINSSLSFKSLTSHLINDERWSNKESLLKNIGNKKLQMTADQLLDTLEEELEQLIQNVNKRIASGENSSIKIKKDGDEISFSLPYPDSVDKENHSVFKQIPQISITEVIQFVQNQCDFMKSFTHIKPYDAKDILDHTAVMACIIANATNLGTYKMAESSDLDYHRMHIQMKNFMRIETLKKANDQIANAIADLPIFKYWDIHDDYIHGSVDGQKFETRLNTFIARYSSKYFGVNKGVVAYTLCANHIPVNARIISANQHESHYLFDMLFNNSSDIDVKWLSGDGHSINQVNFSLLDFIDKQFAPHFKRIHRKVVKICGFKSLGKYKNLFIKPQFKIDRKRFNREWDNIQRIIASLLLGETTQHSIVSKLSSHKRKSKTKDALWGYDRILMSIYLLKFIDNPTIQLNVRRTLNRGEAYHQLRRAIANVHSSKFRGSSERGIELWNECARLMANCMIYYNATILNALLSKLKNEENIKLTNLLKYISPVAWVNINLYGYYTFEQAHKPSIDIEKLANAINMVNTTETLD